MFRLILLCYQIEYMYVSLYSSEDVLRVGNQILFNK